MTIQLGESLRRRRSSSGGSGIRLPPWNGAWRLAFVGLGVAVLGIAVGYFFATRVLFPAPAPPPDLQTVPELLGISAEEAAKRIDEAGLVPGEIDQVRHPWADSGRVIAQAPLPGQLARPRAAVRFTVSLGPERSPVPDVVGLRREWAVNVLEASGFHVVADTVEADEPAGEVVAVEPEPGSHLTVPGEVRISISAGPPLVVMPTLIGMTEEQARDTLQALGLEVEEVQEVFRFGRDQGIVVEQAPPADSLLLVGTTVRLGVGRR